MAQRSPIVLQAGEGEQRWFFGGGVHTWKATAEQTGGSFFLAEDALVKGKVTPLHRHPDHDEMVYVLEGEILYIGDGVERRVGAGGLTITPRGVTHAFCVVSESARLLFMQTPGDGQTFYREASVAMDAGDDKVDFAKLKEIASRVGGMELVGQPPFGKP